MRMNQCFPVDDSNTQLLSTTVDLKKLEDTTPSIFYVDKSGIIRVSKPDQSVIRNTTKDQVSERYNSIKSKELAQLYKDRYENREDSYVKFVVDDYSNRFIIPNGLIEQFIDISSLEDDWDGYGSNAISEVSIDKAIDIIIDIYSKKIHPDTVWIGPSVHAGIKIEMTYKSKEIGIWIEPPTYELKALLMETKNSEKSYIIKKSVKSENVINWIFS